MFILRLDPFASSVQPCPKSLPKHLRPKRSRTPVARPLFPLSTKPSSLSLDVLPGILSVAQIW